VACVWVWEVWARRGVGLGMARAGIGISSMVDDDLLWQIESCGDSDKGGRRMYNKRERANDDKRRRQVISRGGARQASDVT